MQPAGPPFSICRPHGSEVDVEAGWPTAAPLNGTGRIHGGSVPRSLLEPETRVRGRASTQGRVAARPAGAGSDLYRSLSLPFLISLCPSSFLAIVLTSWLPFASVRRFDAAALLMHPVVRRSEQGPGQGFGKA